MQPERIKNLDRIWTVAHWKWELDPCTPRYRCWFFKHIFRPFIHFSWYVMKVPCPKGMEVEIESGKQRFFWFENGGYFSSEDQADLACTGENHGYRGVLLDQAYPPQSAQRTSLVFPRQKNPRLHRKAPTFNLIVKDRKEDQKKDQALAAALTKLNQVLDR